MDRPKRPTDPNVLAKAVLDQTTGSAPLAKPLKQKNPAAVELGRLGGLRGGKARASKLSRERRQDIARRAAMKRWHQEDKS
jgi:hypothetical protein